MRTLAELDPANAMWQRQLASVMEHEARLLRAGGRCDAALPVAEAGLEISAVLEERAAEMEVGQRTRLALLNEKAACLLESDRLLESRALLDELLARAAAPDEGRVDFVSRASALATSRYLAGRARAAAGQGDTARQQWELGLALLEPRQSDPGYRAVQALLLDALGRSDEARVVRAHLLAQGYAEPAFMRQVRSASPGGR
jgi:hypothetical protein